jgi:hypothetical protein
MEQKNLIPCVITLGIRPNLSLFLKKEWVKGFLTNCVELDQNACSRVLQLDDLQ